MVINTIDASMLQQMFISGAKRIEAKKEWINELNVFPVPDGDTGTNMSLTIMAAAKEVGSIETPTMENLSKAISMGALRGARGNSGVILSQLFRGFTKEIKDTTQIDVTTLAIAMAKAVETAYRAVMKPKEGTILTVAKGMAEKAAEVALNQVDLTVAIKEILAHGDYVLSKTPDMLPVLKQAGVVDSGGQGLMEILKGAYQYFIGEEVDYEVEIPSKVTVNVSAGSSDEDILFGYCTEFIIKLEKTFTDQDELDFKAYLTSIGDSIVCVADEDIVKIHVHTNDPGLAIQRALTFGQLSAMKIDNMREEHEEKLIKDAEKVASAQQKEIARKPVGFVSVAAGDGLATIFKEIGVDHVIQGGQTMNPSTEDILSAIEKVHADTVYVLPNNKNIILAAEQARELTTDKEIIVVPTKTVPQGITAVINFVEEQGSQENLERMIEEIAHVKSGQVTYAVRDTVIDDKEIKEGNIMGIGEDKICAVGSSICDTTIDLVSALVDEDSELISIYYGDAIEEDKANELIEELEKRYKDLDVELQYGGQPVYYYVLSVE